MGETMLAAVYHGRRDLRIEEMPLPEPGPGDLLLEIHSAGVCGTDAHEFEHGPNLMSILDPHLVTGHSGPTIIGHEFGGRVVATGRGVAGFAEGDLVASGAGISCGMCRRCFRGYTNVCERYATAGFQLHGGLAQYCVVPASVCRNLSDSGLTDDGAALVQPMSIGVHAMRRGRIESGDHTLVIGIGGVGAFLVYALAENGALVTAADLDPRRLEIAAALGAAETIHVSQEQPLPEALGDAPAPFVIYEASGARSALSDALAIVPPSGAVVVVGHQKQPFTFDAHRFTLAEKTLIGTNAHVLARDLPEAARLVASRDSWHDIAPLALPLAELVEGALLPLLQGGSGPIKTLVDPWAEQRRETSFR